MVNKRNEIGVGRGAGHTDRDAAGPQTKAPGANATQRACNTRCDPADRRLRRRVSYRKNTSRLPAPLAAPLMRTWKNYLTFISIDHAVNHDPDAVPSFDFSPGSAFDNDSGPDLESDSVPNIHNSTTALPAIYLRRSRALAIIKTTPWDTVKLLTADRTPPPPRTPRPTESSGIGNKSATEIRIDNGTRTRIESETGIKIDIDRYKRRKRRSTSMLAQLRESAIRASGK
ncbi:hypothetical protein EVAR_75370_1 [Eumeta japonica]|uniref:Uncharacterized protein n=1 Tax=Eumeta variegata TaxID=151549 RepID=A0A4C1Y900_EUMVA|nr:hypothetical protein EVAR_75370_1 [Eumeta japonica]